MKASRLSLYRYSIAGGLLFAASWTAAQQIRVKTGGSGGPTVRTPITRAPGSGTSGGVVNAGMVGAATYDSAMKVYRQPSVNHQAAVNALVAPVGVEVPFAVDQAAVKATKDGAGVIDFSKTAVKDVLAVEDNVPVRDASEKSERDQPKRSAQKDLDKAVKELAPAQGAEAGDVMGDAASLDKVFDKAHRTKGAITFSPVAGKTQDVEAQIKSKVAVANTASPHDAPGLYGEAIAAAGKTFEPAVAKEVQDGVRSQASKKAKGSVDSLANEAYHAAVSEIATGAKQEVVAQAFDSMGSWQKLLSKPGRPLIGNAASLRSYVDEAMAGSKSASEVGSKGDAEILSNAKRGSSLKRRAAAMAAAAARKTLNKIWFSEDKRTGTLTAMFPTGAVARVPGLALGFSPAGNIESARTLDPVQAFQEDPSITNGFGIIFRENRKAGASTVESFLSAASYGTKAFLGGIWYGGKTWWTGAPGKFSASRFESFSALDERYLGASRILAKTAGAMTLADARALLKESAAMAEQYAILSGDGSAVGAIETLAGHLSREARLMGLIGADTLPAGLAALVDSNEAESVRRWISRIHEAALGVALEAAQTTSLKTVSLDRTSGNRIFGSVKTRSGSAKVYARFPGAGGGMIWISYPEKGNSLISSDLETRGFDLTRREGTVIARLENGSAVSAMERDLSGSLSVLKGEPVKATAALSRRQGLGRLLSDVTKRPGDASRFAQSLQSYDPAPYHYETIGLVGSLEAQSSQRISQKGKPLNLFVLRDAEMGHIAYARAEWASTGRSLSLDELELALP